MVDDIYTTEDNLILSPTAEEEVTKLVADTVFSHKQLPLKLYQIGPKFRKEARPRGGLLRLREFLMKDLYTFDKSVEEAHKTYASVIATYNQIFNRLELPSVQCEASTGVMGGIKSTEFHLLTEVGEDSILHCSACNKFKNSEVEQACCETPNSSQHKGLELGHAFLLGEKYSQSMRGFFTDADSTKKAFQMGCYGIGVSRLLSAIVEAKHDHEGIIWPDQVAPFQASIIFDDSQQESEIPNFMSLFQNNDDVLVDDRPGMSIGKKLKDHLLVGIPKVIVLGQKWRTEGLVEYHKRRLQKCEFLSLKDLGFRLAACDPPIVTIKL